MENGPLLLKNEAALKKHYPEDYEIYKNYKSSDFKSYNLVINNQNIYIPVDVEKKYAFFDLNNTLTYLNDIFKKTDTNYFVITGLLTGLPLKIILKLKPNAVIFVFENNFDMFNLMMHTIDLTEIFSNSNIFFFLDSNDSTILQRIEKKFGGILLLQNYSRINFDKFTDYTLVENYFSGKCCVPYKKYNLIEQIQTNIETIKLFSNLWLTNIFSNMKNFLKTSKLKELENIFYKKTAVIIAGGPSLDKDILNIKNIKNKILIIAVDTAVKKLLNEDICPDIIVSIDISHHNLKHLQNVNCNSILFCDIAMPKSITEKFYSIYFTTGNSISNWIDRQINYNYPIVSIGTVTAAAFDIAYKLGNKNIIFLGTDFCYSSYKTHCETFFNSSMINTLNKFKTFESYFFDSIANDNFIIENKITTSKFLNWKTWFESQIKVLRKNNSINFFNATSDGLKIHGTKNIPSKDIIKFCGSFFDYYNSIKKFKSADSGFFEVSALLEKKLKEYIVSTNDLIKSIEKYFLRLDKFNAHNKTNIMNKIIFLFNKLFRGNDLSDIIRWGLYLDELTFRNLDFLKIEKFDFNINELKQILSNYKKYINVILESL